MVIQAIVLMKKGSNTFKDCRIPTDTFSNSQLLQERVGHISCRGDEATNSVFEKVLKANLNDISTPDYNSVPFYIFMAVFGYLKNVFQFLDQLGLMTDLTKWQYWRNLQWDSVHPNMYPVKDEAAIVQLMQLFLQHTPEAMLSVLKRRSLSQPNLNSPTNIPSTQEVFEVKHSIGPLLVLSQLDKSSGSLDIYWPRILWQLMKSSFWDNN